MVLFIFCFQNAYGGVTKIEELKTQLSNHGQRDTVAVQLLNEIGYNYWIIDPNESIRYGKRALNLSNQLSYHQGLAKSNRIIGVAYWSQGIQNRALTFLNSSKKLYEALNDQEGIANTTLNIGMVYADLNDYEKSFECYESAINDFTALGLKDRVATSFTKMGVVLTEQNKSDEALRYLTDALKMHTANGFTYGIAEVHRKLGILYLKINEFEQASYHTRKSIALGTQLNDNHGLSHNYIILGKILRLEGKVNESLENVEKGLMIASDNRIKQFELLAYEELIELKKFEKKPYEALEIYERYSQLKDTLFDLEKTKQIAFLEFENELDKKEDELLEAKAKEQLSQQLNLLLILGFIIIFIAAIVIVYISKQRIKKGKELALRNKEYLESVQQLTQKELENSELKRQELRQKLEFKNRELSSYALNFIKKNEVVKELEVIIADLNQSNTLEKDALTSSLKRILKKNLSIDKDWEDFSRFFNDVHQGFYANLKSKHEGLTSNDLKLCSLIRLNLNAKEIASILGISPESAKTSRYRLRKKLKLEGHIEITDYLINF